MRKSFGRDNTDFMINQAFKFWQEILRELAVAVQNKPDCLRFCVDLTEFKIPAFEIEFGY